MIAALLTIPAAKNKQNLHKMKQIWNTKHPELKITSNNPKTIWQNLRYIFKETCEKESCWLKHKCFNENIAIGYSYDYSVGNTTFKYNGGSHEILLRYDFMFKKKDIIKSPRYF